MIPTGKEKAVEKEVWPATEELTSLMREQGYSGRTTSDHSRAWRRLLAYADSTGETVLSEETFA